METLIREPETQRQAMLTTDWLRVVGDAEAYFSKNYEALEFSTAEEAVQWARKQGFVPEDSDADNRD